MKVALSRGKVQELYVAILLSWNRIQRDDMLNAETFYVLQLIQDSALMVIFPVFFFSLQDDFQHAASETNWESVTSSVSVSSLFLFSIDRLESKSLLQCLHRGTMYAPLAEDEISDYQTPAL